MSSNSALNAKINALNAKVNDGFARIRSDLESRNNFLAKVVNALQSRKSTDPRVVISRPNKTNKGGKRKTRRRY